TKPLIVTRNETNPGAADSIQYPKHFASRYVNPTYLEFLQNAELEDPNDPTAGARSRSGTFSTTNPPTTAQEEAAVLKPALEKLVKIKGISLEGREPANAWSFSCVSAADRARTDERYATAVRMSNMKPTSPFFLYLSFKEFAAGQENAFSPALDNKGRPLTKWSERTLEALIEPTTPRPEDDSVNPGVNGFGSTMLVLDGNTEGIVGLERRASTDWMKMVEKVEETTTTKA
ncbi:hypothetical protein FRC01_014462, partial [Tulasnella sp. 417]